MPDKRKEYHRFERGKRARSRSRSLSPSRPKSDRSKSPIRHYSSSSKSNSYRKHVLKPSVLSRHKSKEQLSGRSDRSRTDRIDKPTKIDTKETESRAVAKAIIAKPATTEPPIPIETTVIEPPDVLPVSSLTSKLRERTQLQRQLLAQHLGASSHEDLADLLGNAEEKRILDSERAKRDAALLRKAKVVSSATKELRLTKKDVDVKPTLAKPQRNPGDKTEEDPLLDDPSRLIEQEYRGSKTFLKGTQSSNPHNDYCQHFVDTGQRPQNFIRDSGLVERFEEYPKLKELISLKDQLVAETATPPMYLKVDPTDYDLADLDLTFDVIIIEPPLEEYQRSGIAGAEHQFWSWSMISQLNIPKIADFRCFIWLWCGSRPDGLDWGRQCLKQWGFRRCEDISWIKTNGKNKTRGFVDPNSLFQATKEHCLMGIKGTVRRSSDIDFIHANVDIDLIISEEPELGSIEKPTEIFLVAEHFCLGRRRLHLFGRDQTVRPGWLTVGPELTSSNFDREMYREMINNVPGRTTGCTAEIEALRPKSPPPKGTGPAILPQGMIAPGIQAALAPIKMPYVEQPIYPPGTSPPPPQSLLANDLPLMDLLLKNVMPVPMQGGSQSGLGMGRGRAGWGPSWKDRERDDYRRDRRTK